MCFAPCNVKNLSNWNWDGNVIIQQPIVPSGGHIIGSRKTYDIDVREYLTSNRNAVMERSIRETSPRYLRKMGVARLALSHENKAPSIIAQLLSPTLLLIQLPTKRVKAETPGSSPMKHLF
jgi:hypothetical protein